jgi:hypothetical protein
MLSHGTSALSIGVQLVYIMFIVVVFSVGAK